MTIQRTSVDHIALPALLLPQIKEHLRVRHGRDDALITAYIAAAVGLIERKCNVSLDPATYIVTADELGSAVPDLRSSAQRSYALPVNNVLEARVTDDAVPPLDHSADFEVWNPDFGGNGSSFLVAVDGRSVASAWRVELTVGVVDTVATPDTSDLAPAFFALIARLAASHYENREASAALWAETWDSELMGLWRPTA